jgi:hypothetical protein
MANSTQPETASRRCFRCENYLPATAEHFVKDSSRLLGLSYECKSCHAKRRAGRDRRKERWRNLTPDQRLLARERHQRYAKTEKGRAIQLRAAYKKNDECNLSTEEVLQIISQPCTHCGTTHENRGLDRIDNNLPHVRGNVVSSCAPCNFARGDRFTFDEMKIIGAAIRQVMQGRKKEVVDSGVRPGKSGSASRA